MISLCPLPALLCIAVSSLYWAFPTFAQESVVLFPDKDNTLIESLSGSFSNGAAEHLFSGRVGPQGDLQIRRAVLHFDLTDALPDEALLQSVSLRLYHTRTETSVAPTFSLHRLTRDWGEGTSSFFGGLGAPSTEGDATWIHTFYDSMQWQQPGGDFVSEASASLEVSTEGPYVWESTDGLLNDVMHWLEYPEENFGWILISNEQVFDKTAKQFGSRENAIEDHRPQLSLTYEDHALPVELISFSGLIDNTNLYLEWQTASEINNAGFEIQHSTTNSTFEKIGFVRGAGTTNIPQSYTYQVTDLPGGLHLFRLRQIDFDGSFAYSPAQRFTIATNTPAELKIYPTPFNPSTQLNLTAQRSQKVVIALYNVLGQRVLNIYSGHIEEGTPIILPLNPKRLSSGFYHVQARGDFFNVTQSVVVAK